MRVTLLLFLFIKVSDAQLLEDSVLFEKSKDFIYSYHYKILRETQTLYHGSEYILYKNQNGDHPYFLSEYPIKSSLTFREEIFTDVPLLFDLEKERVAILHKEFGIPLELESPFINEFTIQGHRFINIKSKADLEGLKEGIYESLYEGKTKVFGKRTKERSEKLYGTTFITRFYDHTFFYLIVDNKLFRIKHKHDLLNILPQHKKKIKSFIRQNKYSNKNLELLLKQTAHYLDTQLE